MGYLNNTLLEDGMMTDIGNIKVMQISRREVISITSDDKKVKQVSNIRHLGVFITEDGR